MRESIGLMHTTDELRRLILENPDLPLVILAGENACDYDYSTMFCSQVNAYIGEFLDCEQEINKERAYEDRESFEDDVRDYYEYFDECQKMPDDEFDKFIEEKLAEYEPYWKKCIILYVDN